jgi:hypothetical protein
MSPALWNNVVTATDSYGICEEIQNMLEKHSLDKEKMCFAFKCPAGSVGEQALSLLLGGSPVPEFECFYDILDKILSGIKNNTIVIDLCNSINEVKRFLSELGTKVTLELQDFVEKSAAKLSVEDWFKSEQADVITFVGHFVILEPMIVNVLRRPQHIDAPTLSNALIGKAKELQLLCDVIDIKLKSVKNATTFFASQILPHLEMLAQDVQNLTLYSADIRKVRDIVLEEVKSQTEHFMKSSLHCQASALDPRYRSQLLEDVPLVYANCLKSLKDNLKKIVAADEHPDEAESAPSTSSSLGNTIRSQEFGNYVNGKGRRVTKMSKWEVAEIQLQTYYKDNSVLKGESVDVVKYWNERRSAEPFLSTLALQTVAIPVTRVNNLSALVHSKHVSDVDKLDAIFLASVSQLDWNPEKMVL